MQNYFIYKEIGKGKRYTVFKARLKKALDLLAVKSSPKVSYLRKDSYVLISSEIDQESSLSAISSSRAVEHASEKREEDAIDSKSNLYQSSSESVSVNANGGDIVAKGEGIEEDEHTESIIHEFKVLDVIKTKVDENVARFFATYETKNHYWIIMELCAGGTLEELLIRDGRLQESALRVLGRGIASGMYFLHMNGIVHGNIHPSTIILTENGVPKITSFSNARIVSDPSSWMGTSRCTLEYMAPELFRNYQTDSNGDDLDEDEIDESKSSIAMTTFETDVWAFGCLLFELLTTQPPFSSSLFSNQNELIIRIKSSQPVYPAGAIPSKHFANLISALLHKDPGSRLKSHMIKDHKFFATV